MAKADRAVADTDAPADPTEPDAKRHTVLATIGRLLSEGCLRLQAEGGEAEGDTAPRDPSNPDE